MNNLKALSIIRRMRSIVIFLCLCFFNRENIFSQKITFGKAVYKYKFNFSVATSDTLTGDLFFNNSGESYYTTPIFMRMGVRKSTDEQPAIKYSEPRVRATDSLIVYRNTTNKEYYYKTRGFMRYQLVVDTLKDLVWKFTNEKKKIGRFSCKLAKTRFAGRNYDAWFTNEIPISSGPWKLYGLPGLIVEVTDDLGMIYFGLKTIELNPKQKRDFNVEKLRKTAITKKDVEEASKKEMEKLQGFAASKGATFRTEKTVRGGLELEDQ